MWPPPTKRSTGAPEIQPGPACVPAASPAPLSGVAGDSGEAGVAATPMGLIEVNGAGTGRAGATAAPALPAPWRSSRSAARATAWAAALM